MKRNYYTYIMTNHTNTVLYAGVSNSLDHRVLQHKFQTNPNSFSARYKVYKLLWYQEFTNVQDSLVAEKKIKGWTRVKKIALIKQLNPSFKDLNKDASLDSSPHQGGVQNDKKTEQKPIISIIAALSENRVIGKNNQLPWHIPEDLKRFKKLTTGHPVIMGRKTFESIGRPLPNRANIIITRNFSFTPPGCKISHSLEEAIEQAKKIDHEEIFIIGGAQIFAQALPLAGKLYLTIVKGNFEGNAFFPEYKEFNRTISREERQDTNYRFTFLTLAKN